MSAFTASGTENEMRWDGSASRFMEAWYATLTDAQSGWGFWFRYTLCAPNQGAPYCELWGVAFDPSGDRTFAAKKRLPVSALRRDDVRAGIENAWVTDDHLDGVLSDGARSLRWALDLVPAKRTFHHLPESLRTRVEKRVSTVCSPNLGVTFSGRVELDGQTFELDRARGQQGHRWGRRHASTWAWAHCSAFEGSPDAVFEGLAAKANLGPVPGPTLTLLYLGLDGEDIVLNDLKTAMKARSDYALPAWVFISRNDRWQVVGSARAHPDRLVQVTYTDPDASPRYCANSEIASLALEVYRRDGTLWRHHRSLASTGGAHLEFGRRNPFDEIPIWL